METPPQYKSWLRRIYYIVEEKLVVRNNVVRVIFSFTGWERLFFFFSWYKHSTNWTEPLCKVKIPQAFYQEGQFITLSLSLRLEIECSKSKSFENPAHWRGKEEERVALACQETNIFIYRGQIMTWHVTFRTEQPNHCIPTDPSWK